MSDEPCTWPVGDCTNVALIAERDALRAELARFRAAEKEWAPSKDKPPLWEHMNPQARGQWYESQLAHLRDCQELTDEALVLAQIELQKLRKILMDSTVTLPEGTAADMPILVRMNGGPLEKLDDVVSDAGRWRCIAERIGEGKQIDTKRVLVESSFKLGDSEPLAGVVDEVALQYKDIPLYEWRWQCWGEKEFVAAVDAKRLPQQRALTEQEHGTLQRALFRSAKRVDRPR